VDVELHYTARSSENVIAIPHRYAVYTAPVTVTALYIIPGLYIKFVLSHRDATGCASHPLSLFTTPPTHPCILPSGGYEQSNNSSNDDGGGSCSNGCNGATAAMLRHSDGGGSEDAVTAATQ